MSRRNGTGGGVDTPAGLFGKVLRRHREASGLSQDEMGKQLGYSRSSLAKIEAGTMVPHVELAQECDRYFRTDDLFTGLWADIDWYPTSRDHPDWFQRRVQMDAELDELHQYQTMVVPGLLQTEEYAWHLLRQVESVDGKTTEEQVAARMGRQQRFLDPDGPLMVVLMDESCVRSVVGSPAVMADQLRHLLDVGGQPNIRIHMVPAAAALAAPSAPMSLITMPNGDHWLYAESLTGAHISGDPQEIASHRRTYDLLRSDCLNPRDSAELIRTAMEGYTNDDQGSRSVGGPVAQEQLQRQQRRRLHRNSPRLHPRRRPRA